MHPLLDPSARPVVGHRGNAAHAPENTLESFAQAVALGADAIELDVHLSADGVPVVIHDPVVDRTTEGTGAVAALRMSELRALDAGARFVARNPSAPSFQGRGLRIPTLAEVLESFPQMPLLIEIKTPRASDAVRREIETHGADDRCIVASFDAEALRPFRASRIAVGAAQSDVVRLLAPALLRRSAGSVPYRVACVPRSHRGVPLPIRGMVEATRASGCLIHVWTVNDAASATQLWRQGVRGIVSDDPALIKQARDALNGQQSAQR